MAKIEEVLLTDIAHKKDLLIKAGTGDLDSVSGLENIKQSILRRLVTSPGELVHRPEYGAALIRDQGAALTLGAKQDIVRRMDNNLKRDSRIKNLLSVTFENEDEEPSQVIITVKVDLIGYGETHLEFSPFREFY